MCCTTLLAIEQCNTFHLTFSCIVRFRMPKALLSVVNVPSMLSLLALKLSSFNNKTKWFQECTVNFLVSTVF